MKEVFAYLDRCQSCRSCQLACAVEHSKSKNLLAAIAERPIPRYRLFVEQAEEQIILLTCRHCDPAPCIDACIAGCLKRDERGAVVQDTDRCVGCYSCLMVCPYGVVTPSSEPKLALKCDRCPDLTVPACVKACPTKALVYSEPEAFAKDLRRSAAGVINRAMTKQD